MVAYLSAEALAEYNAKVEARKEIDTLIVEVFGASYVQLLTVKYGMVGLSIAQIRTEAERELNDYLEGTN